MQASSFLCCTVVSSAMQATSSEHARTQSSTCRTDSFARSACRPESRRYVQMLGLYVGCDLVLFRRRSFRMQPTPRRTGRHGSPTLAVSESQCVTGTVLFFCSRTPLSQHVVAAKGLEDRGLAKSVEKHSSESPKLSCTLLQASQSV